MKFEKKQQQKKHTTEKDLKEVFCSFHFSYFFCYSFSFFHSFVWFGLVWLQQQQQPKLSFAIHPHAYGNTNSIKKNEMNEKEKE
jgi:hypothetical protein